MPPVRAVAKSLGASQKRLKPILDLVRGLRVEDALNSLSLLPSPWAKSLYKVVASAAANAENNDGISSEELYVTACYADEGPTMKRWRPRARGRATRILKRTCHITIILARYTPEELEECTRQMEFKKLKDDDMR